MVRQQCLWMGTAQRHQVRAAEETLGDGQMLSVSPGTFWARNVMSSLGRAVGRACLAPCLAPAPTGASPGCRGGSSALQKVPEPPHGSWGHVCCAGLFRGASPGFAPSERWESSCMEQGRISAAGCPQGLVVPDKPRGLASSPAKSIGVVGVRQSPGAGCGDCQGLWGCLDVTLGAGLSAHLRGCWEASGSTWKGLEQPWGAGWVEYSRLWNILSL